MPLFTVKRPSVYLHADVILIWLWLLRQLLFVITSKCCAVKSKSRKYQFQVLVCPWWKSNPCMMFCVAVLKIYEVIVMPLTLDLPVFWGWIWHPEPWLPSSFHHFLGLSSRNPICSLSAWCAQFLHWFSWVEFVLWK